MALNNEWVLKFEYCVKSLSDMVCKSFLSAAVSGFVTKERLTLDEAGSMPKKALEVGTRWGHKWEYMWIFAEICVPGELKGQRIVYKSDNGEGIVYVNGEVFGSIDKEHKFIELTDCAEENERFEIVTEVYAGHIEPPISIGTVTAETEESFRKDELQKTLGECYGCVWNENAFSLLMDIKTLYELAAEQGENSLRRVQIEAGLKKVLLLLDFEASEKEFAEEILKAKEITNGLLACKNGTTAPIVYACGHSHLDLEWLWTVNETRRKAARTLGNQLRLLDRYENYKYIQTQPWLLSSVKNEFPELYKRIKKAVSDGKIIPEGGMWVESDLNIPSGESLIRQFMHGKRFIKEEFGKESEIAWLPDVFGCSGAFPQIMKGCGMKYFFNAKVTWTYNGGEIVPFTSFMWRGIDGTEVLSHIVQGYAEEMSPKTIIRKWNECRNKESAPIVLNPFGHGDGGGGATRIHMEYAEREKNLEGMPKVEIAEPGAFYEKLAELGIKDKFEGELYYAAHRGSYTSQAGTKKLNRKAEFALRNAEICSVLLCRDNHAELDGLWKRVLFNQFHDIIPGTAMREVAERAEDDLSGVIAEADKLTENALLSASDSAADAISVFNSLAWQRICMIELPEGAESAAYKNGERLPVQKFGGKAYACAHLEPLAAKSIVVSAEKAPEAENVQTHILENSLVRVEFDENGEITSIYDKEKNSECLSGKGNRFRMFRDMPLMFDAWDIDSSYEQCEVDISGGAEVSAVSKGELFSAIKIVKKFGSSQLEQTAVLRENSKQVDFYTNVDWNERHRLLKVYFETDIHSGRLLSETQFGYVERPTTRNNAYEQDMFEACQHKWSALFENGRGFAILNDCKYGISAEGGAMGLTLLKAPCAPDICADRGRHSFVYSVLPTGSVVQAVRAAYELNSSPTVINGAADFASPFEIDADNVIIDTIKQAEDGSGDIIIRMYECGMAKTKCRLKTGFDIKKAYITDMLENNICEIPINKRCAELELKRFEVATVRFMPGTKVF